MSSQLSVTQSNNTVGGDLVGGNKYEFSFQPTSAIAAVRILLEKLQAEQKTDQRASAIIDDLRRFGEPIETEPIGLEKKLSDGGREYQIRFALEAKQQFVKKIAENTLFESAQEIHVLVLSKIYSVFSTEISNLISQGSSREIVDQAIRHLIIDPLVADLQITSFRYYDTEIFGMLYYLTGNCYINWRE